MANANVAKKPTVASSQESYFDYVRILRDTPAVENSKEVDAKDSAGGKQATLANVKPKALPSALGVAAAARAVLAGKSKKPTVLKTKLVVRGTITASAGTNLTTYVAVEPALSTEYSALKTLFDDVKVIRGRIQYMWTAFGASGPTSTSTMGAVGYSASSNNTPTTIAAVCELDQFQLTNGYAATAGVDVSSPASTTASGLHSFSYKVPTNGIVLSTTSTANFPGAWMAMEDSADTAGNLFVVNEAVPGTASTVSFTYLHEMWVAFRQRQ
jgi:hypothetical protein